MSHPGPPERSRVTVTIEMLVSGVVHTYEFPAVERVSMDYKPTLPDWQTLRSIDKPRLGAQSAQFRIQGEAVLAQPDSALFAYTRTDPEQP
jgi:hypothetical protein